MRHAITTGIGLAMSAALLSAAPVFPQTSNETIANATATPVAYLYVPTSQGIYASSAGKLTVIKGSPFTQTTGLAIGSTGKYFITLGLNWLHSYAIESNGAIGKQVSAVNTLNYGGGDCETYSPENLVFGTDGAVLDHAGQNVYVFINGNWDEGDGCAAYQTFNIATNGALTFNNVDEWYTPAMQQPTGGLILNGTDKFGYAFIWNWGEYESPYYWLTGFKLGTHGALEGSDFSETDPEPQPGYAYNQGCINCSSSMMGMAADSTNHLVFAITPYSVVTYDAGATQLASYTVDSKGNITSTNTWENMPTVSNAGMMSISPAGNLLAFATGTGVQFYHFNGAKPITKFTGLIGTSGYVSRMSWDKSNHLYAINGQSGKLHIYNVTTTSAKEVSGSPYVILGGASNVFVVSR